jgi:hypothetical protein
MGKAHTSTRLLLGLDARASKVILPSFGMCNHRYGPTARVRYALIDSTPEVTHRSTRT